MNLGALTTSSQGAPALDEKMVDALSECVPAIGTDDFTARFLRIVGLIGAGQVTAFAYERAKVSCLLSRNFLSEEKGGTLADAYVEGWYRDDPLFERAMTMDEDACIVDKLEDLLSHISPRYLTMFFGAPGFRTKTAVRVAQGPLRMALNFYFADDVADHPAPVTSRVADGYYRLIGRTLATHFLRLHPPEYPLPLTVLSERERQVCIGMLAGKKAEIIAEEIGIGPSSIVTYRQRAYQKLGISSRGQLFSICRS